METVKKVSREETLEALNKSIERWEKIRDREIIYDRRTAMNDCPLCNLFWNSYCLGCPVYKRTGLMICVDTPYIGYNALHGDKECLEYPSTVWLEEKLQKQAGKQVKFLKSLRAELLSL